MKINYKFFKNKPSKLFAKADFERKFDTLKEAKDFWWDTDFVAMYAMDEEDWPTPYHKSE